MTIWSFFSSISDVIWAGVIASILTLSGVLIADRSSTKRLKIQLKHDAEEKARQRKASLRREVYLNAAEELVKANSYLSTLLDADLSQVNLSKGMQGFFAAATKLQLVSETKTAFLMGELVTKYGEFMFKVFERVIPVRSLGAEIKILDEQYDRTQSEISRILSAMTRMREAGQTDAKAFEALNSSFEFQQAQAKKFSTERHKLWGHQSNLQIEFMKYLMVELRQFAQEHVKVLVQIRRELELEGDVDEFSRHMEIQSERLSVAVDELLKKITEIVDKPTVP